MGYTKQAWANDAVGGTPLSAARLQYVENGLEAAAIAANAVSPVVYTSGQYYLCNSATATATSAALGNSSLRLTRWDVTKAITVDRLWAEVTVVGEAGSKFRIGIWNDDGTGKPGTLLLDAGQINGDSATVQELTVSQALGVGTYWIGGAVQSAATTQPTMRCVHTNLLQHHFPLGTALPAANVQPICWFLGSQTGAFGNFTGSTLASAAARIGFRVT